MLTELSDWPLCFPERTWTRLKQALVRRYGERLDLAQTECQGMQRIMQPGETFADFASGLRGAAGQNKVREETLPGQLYRGLEKPTRQPVKLAPTPMTLGEAVEKTSKIDDSNYDVALDMMHIGQRWTMAEPQTAAQMHGTVGAMQVIPGIGSTPVEATDATALTVGTMTADHAHFTNLQGLFDKNTNVWVVPGGRTWNGRYSKLSRKEKVREQRTVSPDARTAMKFPLPKPDRKAKVMLMATSEDSSSENSSSEGSEEDPIPPRKKKRKAPVRQAKASEQSS
ncbi:unnamed protein product [Phytophthora fragariaefolia]|uniref:Unnamed protein product n=1 Tax=Phytophthora fragariaefolia TaxID=1490495 RepID=A0A9W6XI26_9STRA|nr:unnamed protein product [Phytophthora fragariaefolia]